MGRGLHTVIDGRCSKPFTSAGLTEVMAAAVDLVGMTVIDGPTLYYPTLASVVAVLVLAESHMTVHVADRHVAVDLYSCKEYDTGELVEFVVSELGIIDYTTETIKRGWAW